MVIIATATCSEFEPVPETHSTTCEHFDEDTEQCMISLMPCHFLAP